MSTNLITPKTRSHRIRLHRALWRWLAEDGNRRKKDYPNLTKYVDMRANCFLCGPVSAERGDPKYLCCALIWPGEHGLCSSGNGLYSQWDNSFDKELREELALVIAELKVSPPEDRSI